MRKTIVLFLALTLAATAVAGTVTPVQATATPLGIDRGVVVYSNLATQTGYYFNSLPYTTPQELGDDLYMTSGGVLDSFKFTYENDPNTPPVSSAIIAFYDLATFNMGGGNTPIGAYQVTGLPAYGAWIISVNVQQPGINLPANIMMTQLMDTVYSGPLTFYPPSPGSTTDGIWAGTPDNMFFTSAMFGLPPNTLNFGYEVSIPEPAALGLLALGTLALIRRR